MEICYLLAFPDTDVSLSLPAEQIKGLKDAPYFQPIDIDLVTLGEETVLVEGYAIVVLRQRYVRSFSSPGPNKNPEHAAEPLHP